MADAALDNRIEEDYGMRLNMARKNSRARASESGHREVAGSKISSAEAIMMFFFGVIIDLLSLIPIIGWLIDICGGGVIWLWQTLRGLDRGRPWFLKWMPGIGTVAGFIPFLPAHTATILSIIILNTAMAQNLIQKFSPR